MLYLFRPREKTEAEKQTDTITRKISLGVLALIFFVMPALGGVHGYFWPVMEPVTLTLTKAAPPPAYRYIWSGTAEKYQDCDWIRTEWFLGPRNGRRVQVTMKHLDPPEVRPAGDLKWDEIEIWLDPLEVEANSHADVYHDCGWPWETRTRFYH